MYVAQEMAFWDSMGVLGVPGGSVHTAGLVPSFSWDAWEGSVQALLVLGIPGGDSL